MDKSSTVWLCKFGDMPYSWRHPVHYSDIIMGAMASQVTGVPIVYATICLSADQRNIKAPRHWPLWGEFTGDLWIPRAKGK